MRWDCASVEKQGVEVGGVGFDEEKKVIEISWGLREAARKTDRARVSAPKPAS